MSEPDPAPKKDRAFAPTGWGIKPDDQPANRQEARAPIDVFRYDPKLPDVVRTVLRAQRRSFNTANRVRVEPGKTTVIDINGDSFVIVGLSYGDENLIEVLMALGAAFDPQQVRDLGPACADVREYNLGRVWAWGAERSGG